MKFDYTTTLHVFLTGTLLTILFVTTTGSYAAKSTEDGDATEWYQTIEDLQDMVPDDLFEPPPETDSTGWTAEIVDCSTTVCSSNDQQYIQGERMFNHENFDDIVDVFGRRREFYVHIPARYDSVNGHNKKIPVIFAFHGGGQQWDDAMLDGKWGDYFEQDIAFVIPQARPDPCSLNGKDVWMKPGVRDKSTTPRNPKCNPVTQVSYQQEEKTYWNASLPGAFTDVLFIEQLRAMILDRLPKLNPEKVYATGFSSGGGLSYALLCYRSDLFRGFSVVASTLGRSARGDYQNDGIASTDPNSLIETCGKDNTTAGHATGIRSPQLWGRELLGASDISSVSRQYTVRVTKPVVLFVGDQDVGKMPGATPEETMQIMLDTSSYIRLKNNLTGLCHVIDPFSDTGQEGDRDRQTQRCTFKTVDKSGQPYSTFQRFLVRGGTHAMPDASECDRIDKNFMTCDYDYTEQTIRFFQQYAELGLNP